MKFLLFIAILTLGCYSKNNQPTKKELSGVVIKIIDGDTYDILLSSHTTVRIRMEGIDAPEKGMPFYRVAKNYLGKLCFQKTVRLDILNKDMHGRTVAYSYLDDGTELSHEMVKAGLAWHFKKYSNDSILSKLEIEAKNSKLGLWADAHPMPPWEDRRLHREGISTK